jgi:hypothetical protein
MRKEEVARARFRPAANAVRSASRGELQALVEGDVLFQLCAPARFGVEAEALQVEHEHLRRPRVRLRASMSVPHGSQWYRFSPSRSSSAL